MAMLLRSSPVDQEAMGNPMPALDLALAMQHKGISPLNRHSTDLSETIWVTSDTPCLAMSPPFTMTTIHCCTQRMTCLSNGTAFSIIRYRHRPIMPMVEEVMIGARWLTVP